MPGTPSLIESFKANSIPAMPLQLRTIIGTRKERLSAPNNETERLDWHLLAEALSPQNIPNDATFDSRDEWVSMAHAIYGASSGQDWGRKEWLAWNARRQQTPNEPERVWDTIKPAEVRAGSGYIKAQLFTRNRTELLERIANAEAGNLFSKVIGDEGQSDSPKPNLDGVYFDGDEPPAPVPTIVDELIPAEGLTFLGGQSGAGKTFIAIDLAVSLAMGKPFMGRPTEERLGTIYVAGEGRQTIAPRLEAAKQGRFITDKLPIAVIKDVPDLTRRDDRQKFIAKLRIVKDEVESRFGCRVGIIIIDTLIACFTFKDENSAGEMGAICKAASELGDSIGAATLAVHHYGKDASTGLRGSSSLRGAGESVLSVLGNRDEVEGTCTNRRLVHAKSRVGEEGAEFPFELESIFLGEDHKGRPFSAAYVKVMLSETPKDKADRTKTAIETDISILKAMVDEPGASVDALAKAADRSKSTTDKSLKRMEGRGLTKQNKIDGSWSVTKKGFEGLKELKK
jgi:predicted transcriptional regulator